MDGRLPERSLVLSARRVRREPVERPLGARLCGPVLSGAALLVAAAAALIILPAAPVHAEDRPEPAGRGAPSGNNLARRNVVRDTVRDNAARDNQAATPADLFKQAISLAAQDQWVGAAASGRAALDALRRGAQANDADACTLLEHIAAWQELACDYAGALASWRELEPLSAKVRGEKHWASVGIRLAAQSCQRAAALSPGDRLRLAEAAQQATHFERLFAAGKYDAARAAAAASLETRAALLGREDAITSASLHNLGVAHLALGDAKTARGFLEPCAKIREGLYTDKNPGTLATLSNLTVVYARLGEPKLTGQTFERILTGSSGAYGPTHPTTVRALFQLGNFYLEQDNLTEAKPALLTALKLQRPTLGPKHREIALTYERLGMLYVKKGQHAVAQDCLRKAVDMYRELLGKDNPELARAVLTLGTSEYLAKDYVHAKEHIGQALEIFLRQYGETHPDTVDAMHTLARVLPRMGEQAAAERLYRKVLRIYQQKGENNLLTAATFYELGTVYLTWNDIGKAERNINQSLAIYGRVLGENHPATIAVTVSAAMVDARLGRFDRAEKTCRKALAVVQRTPGLTHAQTDPPTLMLAGVLLMQGKYDESKQHFERLLAGRPTATAEEIYENAIILEKLALIALKKGDYIGAIARTDQVLETYGKNLPEDHPHFADLSLIAGIAELALGHDVDAKRMADRAIKVARQQLDTTSAAQSERQQIALALWMRQILDLELSLPSNKVSAGEAYQHLLLWKGSIQARQIRDRYQRPGDAMPVAAELRQVCTQLATLTLQVPDASERKAWFEQLEQLKERKESLEADLASRSSDVRAHREAAAVTPDKLQAALPADTALVDFVDYIAFSGGRSKAAPDEGRYVAFVVRRDRPVARVDLGSSKQINDTVERWRRESLYAAGKSKTDHGLLLRKLVWEPLAPHVAGCRTVLVSPDSELARLPLGALPGSKPGTYLIEEIATATIPVPQMLPEMLAAPQARTSRLPMLSTPMLIVGDVDYDAAAGETGVASHDQLSKDSLGGELLSFERLQSAPEEIAALRQLYHRRYPVGKLTVLERASATEAAFRSQAPEHPWLLITTHGFFAPPSISSALAVQDEMAGVDVGHGGDHSGALSGLALAGANVPPSPGGDDGILTAYEVAALDLRNVELAVLSGCETGLGRNAHGEGPMGMQRAFQVAGARTTVASLWNVPDSTTSRLMQRYYENLWHKKMSKLDGLREAQLWIMHTGGTQSTAAGQGAPAPAGKFRSPYYWAAFVLSGDWR